MIDEVMRLLITLAVTGVVAVVAMVLISYVRLRMYRWRDGRRR